MSSSKAMTKVGSVFTADRMSSLSKVSDCIEGSINSSQ